MILNKVNFGLILQGLLLKCLTNYLHLQLPNTDIPVPAAHPWVEKAHNILCLCNFSVTAKERLKMLRYIK